MLAAYRIEKFSKTLIKVAWFILKDFSVFAGSNPKLHFFPCGILLVMEFHDKQFHHLMKDFIFQHTFVGINIVMAFIENGREISRRAQLIETWQIIGSRFSSVKRTCCSFIFPPLGEDCL